MQSTEHISLYRHTLYILYLYIRCMKKILILSAAFAAISLSARAADVPTVSAADTAAITVLMNEMADIEVVASRVQQTTSNHEQLTKEDLNKENTGQNLPYLLSKTPGLQVTSDDGLGVGYTYFRVRGTDHTRINMTVNDVPLNDSESQTVFWVNMTDMASSMQSIDVQRGVGTSTNGIASFGASVNMHTLSLRDTTTHFTLAFNGGMYNTFKEMGAAHVVFPRLGDKQDGRFALSARFSKVNSDGFLYHSASDLYSYHADLGYYGRKTNVVLSVFGGKEKTGMGWDGVDYATAYGLDGADRRYNPAGEYKDADGNTCVYPNQTDNYAQQHAQLHLTHRFNQHWALNAALHYTHGGGYYEQYKSGKKFSKYGLDNAVDSEGNAIKKTDLVQLKNLDNHFYGFVASAKYTREEADVQFGGAANNYNGKHWGNVTWTSVPYELPYDYEYYRSTSLKTDANAYAKANWRIINKAQEKLSVYGDLQYRYIHYLLDGINDEDLSAFDVNEHFHFFNPKAGLTYQNGGHMLYGTFAIANREPSRNNYKEDGDQKPLSERLYDYELGYTYSHPRFTVGANLYMMDYDNQLVLTGNMSSTGAYLTKNVKDSYRMGIELTAGVKITDWFRWDGNVVVSRNKILNYKDVVTLYDATTWDWIGEEEYDFGTTTIAFSPSVTAMSLFTFDYKGLLAEIQTNVCGKQYLDNTQNASSMLKAFTTTNLNLQYQLPMTQWCGGRRVPQIRLLAQLNNMFDAKYASNGGSDMSYLQNADGSLTGAWPWFYAQAGINVHAGFVVEF